MLYFIHILIGYPLKKTSHGASLQLWTMIFMPAWRRWSSQRILWCVPNVEMGGSIVESWRYHYWWLVFVNRKIPSFEMDENWGYLVMTKRKPPYGCVAKDWYDPKKHMAKKPPQACYLHPAENQGSPMAPRVMPSSSSASLRRCAASQARFGKGNAHAMGQGVGLKPRLLKHKPNVLSEAQPQFLNV